jgi:hypothetical protein
MPSLTRYVTAVFVVIAGVLCIAWFIGSEEQFKRMAVFFAGFLVGMLAMYIATRVYAS